MADVVGVFYLWGDDMTDLNKCCGVNPKKTIPVRYDGVVEDRLLKPNISCKICQRYAYGNSWDEAADLWNAVTPGPPRPHDSNWSTISDVEVARLREIEQRVELMLEHSKTRNDRMKNDQLTRNLEWVLKPCG